jgi:hypothetical protein
MPWTAPTATQKHQDRCFTLTLARALLGAGFSYFTATAENVRWHKPIQTTRHRKIDLLNQVSCTALSKTSEKTQYFRLESPHRPGAGFFFVHQTYAGSDHAAVSQSLLQSEL